MFESELAPAWLCAAIRGANTRDMPQLLPSGKPSGEIEVIAMTLRDVL
jgi:hypothetical protein